MISCVDSKEKSKETLFLYILKSTIKRIFLINRRRTIEHCIVTAVKLIAPAIEADFSAGYEL